MQGHRRPSTLGELHPLLLKSSWERGRDLPQGGKGSPAAQHGGIHWGGAPNPQPEAGQRLHSEIPVGH